MKLITRSVVLILSLTAIITFAETVKYRVQTSGMSCGSCVKKIQKAFTGLPGVSDVKVDLDSQSFHLVFDDTKVSDDIIKLTLEDAGYSFLSAEKIP